MAFLKQFNSVFHSKPEKSATVAGCHVHHERELGIPPPPSELIAQWDKARKGITEGNRLDHNAWHWEDTPLASLYQVYVYLILDLVQLARLELAHFEEMGWSFSNIPDPHEGDHERLAMIACITKLLLRASSDREARKPARRCSLTSMDTRADESLPAWAAGVTPLLETLKVPHWDDSRKKQASLPALDDEHAWPEFNEYNILIKTKELLQPHYNFNRHVCQHRPHLRSLLPFLAALAPPGPGSFRFPVPYTASCQS